MSTAEAEQNANSNSYREEQCMEFCLSCAFSFLCDSSSHTINSHFFLWLKGRKQRNQKDITYLESLLGERFWDC